MRLLSTVAALAAGALISACATVGDGPAAPVTPVAAFDAARLLEHARVLSDDSFEGRGIGTPAEDRVVRYLSEQYAAAGFQPGGENGGWTQAVTLNRFTASNIQAGFKVGGETMPLAQGQQIVVSTRLPGDHVTLSDAPLVFAGYGLTAPERNWDDFQDVDVRGKVIGVLVHCRGFETPAPKPLHGPAHAHRPDPAPPSVTLKSLPIPLSLRARVFSDASGPVA